MIRPHIPLILASTSIYRRQLLERLQVDFKTFSPDVDETAHAGESAEHMVQRLAIAKAEAARGHYNDGLVVGSDQACVNGAEILGKPGNHEEATRQLSAASGKTVTFLTGLCVLNLATGSRHNAVEQFWVHFKQLGAEQIENYLRREEPYQCAGSFKSEGLGITLFEKLVGDDPTSLVGLPLIRLCDFLEKEGLLLPLPVE